MSNIIFLLDIPAGYQYVTTTMARLRRRRKENDTPQGVKQLRLGREDEYHLKRSSTRSFQNAELNLTKDLTDKQRIFCQRYIIHLNKYKAYREAGYSARGRSGRSSACTLYKQPKVRAYVDFLMDERAERLKVDADDVVRELCSISFSAITDYMKWEGTTVTLRNSDQLTAEQASCVKSVRQKVLRDGTKVMEFDLHGKQSALKMLGDHLGMFKKEKEGQDELTPEDRAQRVIAAIRAMKGQVPTE